MAKVSTQMTYIDVAYAIHIQVVRSSHCMHPVGKAEKKLRGKKSVGIEQRKGPTTVYYFQFPCKCIAHRP